MGKLFHQQAVARQHAGMMHADTAEQQALQRFAELRGELALAQRGLYLLALFLAGNAEAGKRLGGSQRCVLREMNDIERPLIVTQGKLHRALQRHKLVLVLQRNGARRIGDHIDVGTCFSLQGRSDGAHVAERGAHQQELGVRKREQRHLPGPAAVGVGIEMELVHGHAAHVRPFAFAQGLVGQDLGRAADYGGAGVYLGIARDHAHVFAPQHVNQAEELLADQGLDGRSVECTLALAQRHEHHADGHHALARARGRAQDNVVAHHQAHQRFILVRPQLYLALGEPVVEQL